MLPAARHEPPVHRVHKAAPVELKEPAGHVVPAAVSAAPLGTVCKALTAYEPVPPAEPDDWDTMYVPSATPAPDTVMSGASEPAAMAETVIAAELMDPVKLTEPEPSGQKEPAGHVVPTGVVAPWPQVVPAAHGKEVCEVLPVDVQKPGAHALVQVLTERPAAAPYTPAGQGFAVAEAVPAGQKNPIGHWLVAPVGVAEVPAGQK